MTCLIQCRISDPKNNSDWESISFQPSFFFSFDDQLSRTVPAAESIPSRLNQGAGGGGGGGGINDLHLLKPVLLSSGFRKCLFLKKSAVICAFVPCYYNYFITYTNTTTSAKATTATNTTEMARCSVW